MQRTIGRTPEVAALRLFVASTLTEVSQDDWPRGVFAGRIDVLELRAWAVGVAMGYVAEQRWAHGSGGASVADLDAAA